MTVQTVVNEVCGFVGVRAPPGTIFTLPTQDRTMWEMVQLANEMAQRISYDTAEWTKLRKRAIFTGPGIVVNPGTPGAASSFPLPTDFQRMLKTAQVWGSRFITSPMTYIADPDEWLRREVQAYLVSTIGEWTMEDGHMLIRPPMGATETVQFYYLRSTCVNQWSGTGYNPGDHFVADLDTFVLPERLLKLGMIWQWKAYKGGSYAEDIANYEDALGTIAGYDKPAPILIGVYPRPTNNNIAYNGPTPPASTFVGPGP